MDKTNPWVWLCHHGSVLQGRLITVEKAKRRRGRTPTPGRYLGLKTTGLINNGEGRRRSPTYRRSYSPTDSYSDSDTDTDREMEYSSRSPVRRRHRHRSYSPLHSSHCSASPYYYARRGGYRYPSCSPTPTRSTTYSRRGRRRSSSYSSSSVSPVCRGRSRRSYSPGPSVVGQEVYHPILGRVTHTVAAAARGRAIVDKCYRCCC